MSSDSLWDSWRARSGKAGKIADFCDDLRRARESQGVTLEAIAEKTGLSLKILEALETGRWHEIENPYLIGYIRLYAHAVELNTDKIVARFRDLSWSSERGRRAKFDDTGDLLPRPEAIGATRMKVTLGWLAASRRFTFFLFLFLLAAFLTLLISTKRLPKRTIPLMPFQQTLSYAQKASHGPIEFISAESSPDSSVDSTAIEQAIVIPQENADFDLIAREPCFVVFKRGDEIEDRRHLQPFDTLRIPVSTWLFLTAKPAGKVRFLMDGGEIPPISLDTTIDTFKIVMIP